MASSGPGLRITNLNEGRRSRAGDVGMARAGKNLINAFPRTHGNGAHKDLLSTARTSGTAIEGGGYVVYPFFLF